MSVAVVVLYRLVVVGLDHHVLPPLLTHLVVGVAGLVHSAVVSEGGAERGVLEEDGVEGVELYCLSVEGLVKFVVLQFGSGVG